MPRLTISERNQIIGMLNSNVNFSIISIFNCFVKQFAVSSRNTINMDLLKIFHDPEDHPYQQKEKRDVLSEATKGTDF